MDLTITEVSEAIQAVFGSEVDELGVAVGFVKRQRVLSGNSFAQALVFGYLASPAATNAELSQMAGTVGTPLSRQGLAKRFTPAAVALMRAVLARAMQPVVRASEVSESLLKRFNGVYVQDSTVITLPNELAETWQSCGGRTASTPRAAMKLTFRYDLKAGSIEGPVFTAGRVHDRVAANALSHLPPGALRLADAAYWDLDELESYATHQVGWLMRYKVGLAIYSQHGQRLDLLTHLRRHAHRPLDHAIRLGSKHRLPCRLIAVPVPPAVLAQRRQRLQAEAEDKCQPVSAIAWELAAWTILLTNLPFRRLSTNEALILATCRWQIECLFKLWKQHGHLDDWRSANPSHILCQIYAKLVALLLQHWLIVAGTWHLLHRSLVLAARLIRYHTFHLAAVLAHTPDQLLPTLLRLCPLLAQCRMTACRSKPHTYEFLLSTPLYS